MQASFLGQHCHIEQQGDRVYFSVQSLDCHPELMVDEIEEMTGLHFIELSGDDMGDVFIFQDSSVHSVLQTLSQWIAAIF